MLLTILTVTAFAPPSHSRRAAYTPTRASSINVIENTAGSAAAQAQAEVLTKLLDELGLYERDPFSTVLGDVSASIRSFTNEPPAMDSADLGLEESRAMATGLLEKPKKNCEVTWCSALSVSSASQCLSTITCWNAPVLGVPNFYSSFGASDGGIDLCIDFRPRADASYGSVLEDGTYPEPTTREMVPLTAASACA